MNDILEPTGAPQSAATSPAVDVETVVDDPAVQAVTVELQKYASQTGLEAPAQQTLSEAFRPVFVKANGAIAAARGVAESVKDPTCVREIKRSRECRLAIREVRLEGEKIHKSQKESALRFGKAVDGFKNILLAELAPVEEALEAAEKTAERAEAARLAALKAQRESELLPLLDGSPILADLSMLSDDAWTRLLADHLLLKQAKIDAAARLEADRLAKEAADRADRERIAAENARLKAEAEATAKRLEAERKRVEAERQAERDEAERQAEALRQKLAAERKAAEDLAKAVAAKADAERRAIEAKAKAAADKAREEARKLAAESAKLKAELEAKAKAEALAAAAELARVETERKAQESAARRAAAAPDKAKLEAYLVALDAIQLPQLSRCTDTALIEAEYVTFTRQVRKIINAMIQTNTQLL